VLKKVSKVSEVLRVESTQRQKSGKGTTKNAHTQI
jgi:hypothetical protein